MGLVIFGLIGAPMVWVAYNAKKRDWSHKKIGEPVGALGDCRRVPDCPVTLVDVTRRSGRRVLHADPPPMPRPRYGDVGARQRMVRCPHENVPAFASVHQSDDHHADQ
jgi:hypothetical protein